MKLSSQVLRREPLLKDIHSNFSNEVPIEKFSKNRWLKAARRKPASFPTVPETEVVRHYHRLAKLNYSWEDGLYPLGSCTMKYNPVVHDALAGLAGFSEIHPALPANAIQGALGIIYETERMLSSLLDMAHVSLLPAAGAHGELIGVMMIARYFEDRGEKRPVILIPDSAHGTNPASAAMAGFSVLKVPSNSQGLTDIEALARMVDGQTAAMMLTNPNTLGVFEEGILKIKDILDSVGALLYVDGANYNALLGRVSFGAMGVDLTQLNLHKTFSTPHGGGGPGQGAIACSERLMPYLPSPQVLCHNYGNEIQFKYFTPVKTIGKMKAFYGQFGNIVRAWAYLKTYGKNVGSVADIAVLNANYLKNKIQHLLEIASPQPSMHEAVFSHKTLMDRGISTLQLAKSLLDYGFYAPTIYFPLNVPGAIMIEPTETETRTELDRFAAAIEQILTLSPDELRHSPRHSYVQYVDETGAARNPKLNWR